MFKLLVLALVATAVLAAPQSKINSELNAKLSTGKTANVLVSMKEKTSTVLSAIKGRAYNTRDERVTYVAESLMEYAKVSQKAVAALLSAENIKHEVFWITNQVYIREADLALIEKLAAITNVADISEEFEVKLIPTLPGKEIVPPAQAQPEWGVLNTKAPEVWALGNEGEGAVVGSIDTGGLSTHKDLADSFRGTEYGWRDVTLFGTQTPRDDNGHGTHTIGTIAGQNGIGVAPKAKWISCKGLNGQGGGTNAGLISCGQWMACPTLPNGNSPDCTKAPHVVSNSWGGGQANPFYNEVINAWHAANIIPVFANGNSGPTCGTANSPADSLAGVVAVGAIAVDNSLAYFSSVGPTSGGRMKPDISAPGLDVRSAWMDGAYNTISGTSMATPHVSGVVALLKAQNPDITYEQVVVALYSTANRQGLVPTGANCGGINDGTVFPNHAFGNGTVNALEAYKSILGL